MYRNIKLNFISSKLELLVLIKSVKEKSLCLSIMNILFD